MAYELPPDARSEKTGRGQVQYWFLFRFNGSDAAIDVIRGSEFRAWKWTDFDSLLDLAVDFRKTIYRKLADRFRRHTAQSEVEPTNGETPAD